MPFKNPFFGRFFLFIRAAPIVYGSLQARDPIRAVVSGLSQNHSNWNLSHICDLHHSSQQLWVLNPLSKARNRTHVLMDTSWAH